jgi:septal ring factor EnvC (AmiA/AmiB activator)
MRNDLMTLARAVVALQQRVAETEVNTTEVRPQLTALKVHSESLPQALRELRRSETAMKKRLDALEGRLRALEGKDSAAPVNA